MAFCARASREAAKDLSRQFEWSTIAERHVEMYQHLGVSG